MKKNLDYDEESISEKVKEKGSIFGIIGLGIMGFVHTLSHIIPAIGAIGLSQVETHTEVINILGVNVAPILTNPVMQIAYLLFVPLSFYYIYRDHIHHKHEKAVRKELEELKRKMKKK